MISKGSERLQNLMDDLKRLSEIWNFVVNVAKSQVVIMKNKVEECVKASNGYMATV